MTSPPRGAGLDEIRAFEAVARLGTVRAAADELARTQPSITSRLLALEAAWGTRLFVRRARGMELTPEGRRLLPRARAVLEASSLLDREAGLPLAGPEGVRIGSGDALGRGLVPRALRRLLREHDDVAVRVREGSGGQLLEALRAGEIDVALVPESALADATPGLSSRLLLRSPVHVLLPPGHGLRMRGGVEPASLRDLPLVLTLPGSSFRGVVEAAWAKAGLPLRVAVEVGSWSLVRRYVEAGLGAAPVPAVAFTGEPGTGRAESRPLQGVAPVAWRVVRREGAPVPAATERLLSLLADEAR